MWKSCQIKARIRNLYAGMVGFMRHRNFGREFQVWVPGHEMMAWYAGPKDGKDYPRLTPKKGIT